MASAGGVCVDSRGIERAGKTRRRARERRDTRASDAFGCATGLSRSFAVRRRFRYGGARARVWRPYVVNNTPTGARLGGPPLSYPIDRSSRQRKKVRTVGEKYLGPNLPHPRIAVYSMRDSLRKITPSRPKSRVGRPPTVVLPIGSTLEQIFCNESSEIGKFPEKAPILARLQTGVRESSGNFWQFFGRDSL